MSAFTGLARPSPVATQYKRQSEMYGQALRNLSRAARRGDLNAGQEAIKLRNEANAEGFAPGGISRAEDFQGNVGRYAMSRENEAADLSTKNELDRRNADLLLGRGTANPNATEGAGYGMPLSRSNRLDAGGPAGATPNRPVASSNGGEWVDIGGAKNSVASSLEEGRPRMVNTSPMQTTYDSRYNTANPNATAGAGYGTPISRRGQNPVFSDADRQLAANLSGVNSLMEGYRSEKRGQALDNAAGGQNFGDTSFGGALSNRPISRQDTVLSRPEAPVAAPPSEVVPQKERKLVAADDKTGWIRPGADPYLAKKSLTNKGYTDAQADVLLRERGVTDKAFTEAYNKETRDAKSRAEASASRRAKQKARNDASVDDSFLRGSIAGWALKRLQTPNF